MGKFGEFNEIKPLRQYLFPKQESENIKKVFYKKLSICQEQFIKAQNLLAKRKNSWTDVEKN